MLGAEQGDDDLLGLRAELALIDQNIDRRHNADEHIEHTHDNTVNRAGKAVEQGSQVDALQDFRDLMENGVQIFINQLPQVCVGEQLSNPAVDGFIIALQTLLLQQFFNAADQIRDDQSAQRIERQQQNQQRGHYAGGDAEAVTTFFAPFCPFLQQLVRPFDHRLHHRVHQVGKDAAKENGRNNIREFEEEVIKAPQVGKNNPEHQRRHNDQKGGQPPFEIFLISMEFQISFSFPEKPREALKQSAEHR